LTVLLAQSGSVRENQRVAERAMDSNDLERERGITILAKVTSLTGAKRASTLSIRRATPTSAVRLSASCTWSMARSCWSMPLKDRCRRPSSCCRRRWHRPQADRRDQQDRQAGRAPEDVIDEVFDLFAALDADNDQLDFPVLYGSAKQGWMAMEPAGPQDDMSALFDLVVKHVPAPVVEEGRSAAGDHHRSQRLSRPHPDRPHRSGTVKPNQPIKALTVRRQGG
jgi:GTP-binding protein